MGLVFGTTLLLAMLGFSVVRGKHFDAGDFIGVIVATIVFTASMPLLLRRIQSGRSAK